MKKTDYIIVGQGIAGSLLSRELKNMGKSFVFIDKNEDFFSSSLAAGLINPITGRRFVKSWMIDELIPVALSTFEEIEKELSIHLINKKNIIRVIKSTKQINDWNIRSGDAEYTPYIIDNPEFDGSLGEINNPFHLIEITDSYQINIGKYVEKYRNKLKGADQIIFEEFDHSQLVIEQDSISYKDIKAKGIIFSEGFRAMYNPLFDYLPYNPSKGEILHVDIPRATFDKMLKNDVYVVRLNNGLYWIGSNYSWNDLENTATKEAREELEDRLGKAINLDFEVIGHYGAVRPTVKDRRPFLGTHPIHKNVFMFNGLGTKGTSLGPYFSKIMVEYLLDKKELDKEIDIKRF